MSYRVISISSMGKVTAWQLLVLQVDKLGEGWMVIMSKHET